MIFDTIENLNNYKDMPKIYKALTFLSDKNNYKDAVLIENELFCSLIELKSKPESECVFEAHKKYIDLHFLIDGVEVINTANSSSLKVDCPYNEEKDICFLSGQAETISVLDHGKFMVCFPSDAHKVAIMNNEPDYIKKIVFKILVDE